MSSLPRKSYLITYQCGHTERRSVLIGPGTFRVIARETELARRAPCKKCQQRQQHARGDEREVWYDGMYA